MLPAELHYRVSGGLLLYPNMICATTDLKSRNIYPEILRTNGPLKDEGYPIFYGQNAFRVKLYSTFSENAQEKVDRIEESGKS
jgi:hypothetical protein